MYFDGVVRIIGNLDISEMQSYVKEIPDSVWDNDWRKRVNSNFYESNSVWMKSMPLKKDRIFHVFDSSCTCQHIEFQQAYNDFEKRLECLLEGTTVRSCIIRLLPGNSVKRHIDGNHDIFRYCYRIIIPIVTNEKAVLQYDDYEFVLEEGIVYDTNPFLPHSTFNGGQENRYQAVIDVLPNTIPKDIIEIKKYEFWDYKLFQSMEPVRTFDRNIELPTWEERYEKEKEIAKSHTDIFKYSDISNKDKK